MVIWSFENFQIYCDEKYQKFSDVLFVAIVDVFLLYHILNDKSRYINFSSSVSKKREILPGGMFTIYCKAEVGLRPRYFDLMPFEII